MEIVAEIGEGGVLRIKSPESKPGDIVRIPVQPLMIPPKNQDWWPALQEVFHEADRSDYPRRSYDEIIHDLHDIRG